MNLDLDDLKRLANAATSGPWILDREDYTIYDDHGLLIAQAGAGAKRNGPFIAAAREAVPVLVERVRAQDAEIKTLRNPMCSVCTGTGTPISGRPCICGGTGHEGDEIMGLRRLCYELEDEVARLRGLANDPRAVKAGAAALEHAAGPDLPPGVEFTTDARLVLRAAIAAVLKGGTP